MIERRERRNEKHVNILKCIKEDKIYMQKYIIHKTVNFQKRETLFPAKDIYRDIN